MLPVTAAACGGGGGTSSPTTHAPQEVGSTGFCQELADYVAIGPTVPTSAPTTVSGPSSTVAEDAAARMKAADLFDRLTAVAPTALKGDVDVLHNVTAALAKVDATNPASFAKVLAEALKPEVQASAQRIQDYAKTQCGLNVSLLGRS